MSDRLEQDLREDEGERLYVYPDQYGFSTIGVGILVDKRRGGGLRPEESAFILQNRIALKRKELNDKLPWFAGLDPVRQDALTNMAFQLGTDGLLGFKNSLGLVQQGRWAELEPELKRSKWFLIDTPDRAGRVIKQLVTGKYRDGS